MIVSSPSASAAAISSALGSAMAAPASVEAARAANIADPAFKVFRAVICPSMIEPSQDAGDRRAASKACLVAAFLARTTDDYIANVAVSLR